MKYRKKPVVIEAEPVAALIDDAKDAWRKLPDWFRKAYYSGVLLIGPDFIDIKTSEGTMRGNKDDWIIRGVRDELYPCKPDVFAATYEEA